MNCSTPPILLIDLSRMVRKFSLKILAFTCLCTLFVAYSCFVYTSATELPGSLDETAMADTSIVKGKILFQQYNCIACHQLYGLGGYIGPDLTTVISQPGKGEPLARALLMNGSQRMPNFHLQEQEIQSIINYLKYIDITASTYKVTPLPHIEY